VTHNVVSNGRACPHSILLEGSLGSTIGRLEHAMIANDLNYGNLTSNILQGYLINGRTESASFMVWYLENICRLDDVSSVDCVCDGPDDGGIDAVYVDDDSLEVTFYQAKVRQNNDRTIGDQPIRDFAGSVAQVDRPEKVAEWVRQRPGSQISMLLERLRVQEKLAEGYSIRGVFITNSGIDENGWQAIAQLDHIDAHGRDEIPELFVEIDKPDHIAGEGSFDVSDTGFLEFHAANVAKFYLVVPRALELLALGGIADGSLFAKNVRLSLGNTKVNKDIEKSISDKDRHRLFPMYHNGITLLCQKVEVENDISIRFSNYVVVNGAQSLSVLYKKRANVTDDLRLVVKIIEVGNNEQFSKDITIASNNQNSIKPRDLRSTHLLQIRLQSEFDAIGHEAYKYAIKRGEYEEGTVIQNEEAGRIMLAFDLLEPWSCHQIYKVFDEKYGEIFGRPSVTAWRIILLHKISEAIVPALGEIKSEPIQRYRLTRYFILYSLSKLISEDEAARDAITKPQEILVDANRLSVLLGAVEGLARRICVDLRFEFLEAEPQPDYKAVLKSPVRVAEIESRIRKSYLHDIARGREQPLGQNL
jgi:hypothetical protein